MSTLYQSLPPLSSPKIVCSLDKLGLLRVRGDDAEEFLNRLVTCKLEPQKQQPQLCSLCNPKGRVITCFTVFYKDSDIYLQMPHELVDITLQRLKMYVLTAKVQLNNASDDLEGIGYIGSKPLQTPDNNTVLQAPGLLPHYFIYTDKSQIPAAWKQAQDADYRAKDYSAWHYSDIACGIPKIYPPTVEKLTPQMINLDLIDAAVNFCKGCYPGQEVVARTHYLGKPKRRCYLFSAESNEIEVGTSVYHSDRDEACGIVVDQCDDGPDCSLGLISIRIDAAETPGLYVKTRDYHPLVLHIEKCPPST